MFRTAAAFLVAAVLTAALSCRFSPGMHAAPPIDRHALVTRHNPTLRQFDIEAPLSLGNGEFAFTADITGLQSFAEAYDQTIPLGTLSQWGCHTAPNPNSWSIEKFRFTEFASHGRQVGYADIPNNERTPEINWLRGNPHRLHLGRIGFRLAKSDGRQAKAQDLTGIEQTLDLWQGLLISRFTLNQQPVEVHTVVHPNLNLIAARIISPALGSGNIAIQISFPYGTGTMTAADWSKPDAHQTQWTPAQPGAGQFTRRLDHDVYYVAKVNSILRCTGGTRSTSPFGTASSF
jgi:hypothetical protein